MRSARREAADRASTATRGRDARFRELAAQVAPALAELLTLQRAFVSDEREGDPFELAFYPEERDRAKQDHDDLVREMTEDLRALYVVERWMRESGNPKPRKTTKVRAKRSGNPIREAVVATAGEGSSVRELALIVIAKGCTELPPGWERMTVAQLIQHEMRATRLAWNRHRERHPRSAEKAAEEWSDPF